MHACLYIHHTLYNNGMLKFVRRCHQLQTNRFIYTVLYMMVITGSCSCHILPYTWDCSWQQPPPPWCPSAVLPCIEQSHHTSPAVVSAGHHRVAVAP
jgi:hypothetical protein